MFSSNNGLADLAFERRGGRTVLACSHVVAPLAVVRPFELADGGLAVQLITLGPGLCAGDTLRIDMRAAAGTRVVVTTTAASRIMSMDAGVARQDVQLTCAAGATLEYYPAIAIPFPRSAFEQTVRVDAAAGSRVGVLEAWALGRTARDEYLEFTRIESTTTLQVDGALVHAEAMVLDPSSSDLPATGLLERRRYVASGVWYGLSLPPGPGLYSRQIGANADLAPGRGANGANADLAPGRTDVVFAQSRANVAYLRALADSGPAIEDALGRSVEQVTARWGLAPVPLRRLRC
jgi:urease accessory protein UreH